MGSLLYGVVLFRVQGSGSRVGTGVGFFNFLALTKKNILNI